MTAFGGARGGTPRGGDGEGNRHLIGAAREAGVRRFVLVSIRGAGPEHPIDVYRMKHLAEQELMASDLDWTILRPTVYMERWGEIIGRPVLEGKATRVFGAGDNPISFISADDVARMIVRLLDGATTPREAVNLAGPENLTLMQVVAAFEKLAGRPARVQHVPVPVLRAASVLLKPITATGVRFAQAGLDMAIAPMAADPAETRRFFPDVELTTFPEFVGRLPVLATLEDVDELALNRILREPKNALVKQYHRLFEMEGIDLTLAEEALGAIARKAIDRKTGARGLRSIMEHALIDTMFYLPTLDGVAKVVIDDHIIEEGAKPLLVYREQKASA